MFTPQALAEAVHTAIELLPDVTVNGYHIEWRAPLVAHLTDDGDGAAVSDHYCGICREDRCRHTMAVAAAWDMALAEVGWLDGAEHDYHEERADRRAVMAGVA